MITFVNVEQNSIIAVALSLTTHYGTAMAALAQAPAVNLTTLHGSVSSCLNLQQRTLRYE